MPLLRLLLLTCLFMLMLLKVLSCLSLFGWPHLLSSTCHSESTISLSAFPYSALCPRKRTSKEPQSVSLPFSFTVDLATCETRGQWVGREWCDMYSPDSFLTRPSLAMAKSLYWRLQILLGISLLQTHLQMSLLLVHVLVNVPSLWLSRPNANDSSLLLLVPVCFISPLGFLNPAQNL